MERSIAWVANGAKGFDGLTTHTNIALDIVLVLECDTVSSSKGSKGGNASGDSICKAHNDNRLDGLRRVLSMPIQFGK
jgi:hypothetical protein